MNISLPNLTKVIFDQLHNSCWRLHDDGTQVEMAKKVAAAAARTATGKQANLSLSTFKSEWLKFDEIIRDDRKTRTFRIHNKLTGHLLGEIRWAGKFACYSLYPEPGYFYSATDLADIQEFIDLAMGEWKKGREQQNFEKEKVLK